MLSVYVLVVKGLKRREAHRCVTAQLLVQSACFDDILALSSFE